VTGKVDCDEVAKEEEQREKIDKAKAEIKVRERRAM